MKIHTPIAHNCIHEEMAIITIYKGMNGKNIRNVNIVKY
jgi:hypothetical protein